MVFVGPSLTTTDLDALDPDLVEVRPPIRRGDLGRAVEDGHRSVGIVDGEFFQSLAVSPKEILACLYDGVSVVGGASMGALRAAELHPYGMVGAGEIYGWYRSGRLTRDDDVAVTYGRLDEEYVVTNVPMVNVIWAMDCARRTGRLDAGTRRRITSAARRIAWADRTWPLVCRRAGLPAELCDELVRFGLAPENNLKRLDALATVALLASSTAPAPVLGR